MSTDNERELRQRLGGLLERVEPGPAPVMQAVRQGKVIRMRRWVSAAAGLAIIAAGAVLLPGFLQGQTPVPAGQLHYKVTVQRPGKGSPAGLIAYGTVNGGKWRAMASGTGANLVVSMCGSNYVSLTSPADSVPGSVTAFEGGGSNEGAKTVWCLVSEVRRGVTMITMALGNGVMLDLHPVSYHGVRLIAFALPVQAKVLRATAYQGTRVVAYAIPFNGPGSLTIQTWLRPGQQPPAISAARLPRALAGHGRWTASVHAGPWGTCSVIIMSNGQDTTCEASRSQTQLVTFAFGAGGGPAIVGTRSDVAYVVLTLKNGRTIRVQVARVAGSGYFAVGTIRDPALLRWTAYSAAGQDLGGGPGVPGATKAYLSH